MKIGVLVINGKPYQKGKLPATDANGNKPYYIGDTLPPEYNDITSIENWADIASKRVGAYPGFRDWKALRSEIATMVGTVLAVNLKDWDTFDQSTKDAIIADFQDDNKFNDREREIAAKYFTIPLDIQLVVKNDLDYWIQQGCDYYHPNSVASREKRYMVMLAQVFSRIKSSEAKDIEKELNQVIKGQHFDFDGSNNLNQKVTVKTLRDSYIQSGIETFSDDGQDGFVDYVDSTNGTIFEGNGFKDKSYTVRGMAGGMTELGNKLKDIALNGNY